MSKLSMFLLSLVAVFAPIQPMLIAAFVLAGVDLVVGVIAAIRQKQAITSSKFKRTVGKIFLYEMAILMSYVAETYLLSGLLPITKIIAAFIGTVELKSILENLDAINGSPLFASIISKIASSEDEKLK